MTHVKGSATLNGLHLTEHTLTVPLVYEDLAHGGSSDSRTLEIFARVATRPGGEHLPYLVFLQGGPGCEAPRPSFSPLQPNWLDAALEHYQLVLLDQRGTGRSTPVGDDTLERLGSDATAEYLTHLRADSIVNDCEALREHLGVERWSVLGQSFGGFTLLNYLSRFPESVESAYFTGGLSAVGRPSDDIYALCYDKMRDATEAFYRRFPQHRDTIRGLVEQCRAGEITLPDGEIVSESRLRSLGHCLGSNDGWLGLHYLLECDPRSNAFRYDLASLLPYGGRNPLYYVIHESSYADGCVTDWAAERTMPGDFRDDVTLLTGEHVRREWLDTVPALMPWKEVALRIAAHEWPRVYDADALAASGAHGAAAVYYTDVYVPVEFSMQTARLLPGVRTFVTSEHEHNGLRASGGELLSHLIDLAHGRVVR
ncbi:alpha/beta fold hydrolase [Devriesea agamarum]|uniref:alpha/beta fold hydrolase n=1 Tax=Devriesea agamarum TaxID=472569 RepID=UPI000ABDEF9D